MTDDRIAGVGLIVGSVGAVVTMILHPVGGRSMTAVQLAHLTMLSNIAHGLALASCLTLLLGAVGLASRLGLRNRLALCALVTFGLAVAAILIAGSINGFVIPKMMEQMSRDLPEAAATWRIAMAGLFDLNQTLARIYTVGTGVAMVLWSVAGLRLARLGRGVGRYGVIGGTVLVMAMVSGHLRLDVHGMAAVVLVQTVWFVIVGRQMMEAV